MPCVYETGEVEETQHLTQELSSEIEQFDRVYKKFLKEGSKKKA